MKTKKTKLLAVFLLLASLAVLTALIYWWKGASDANIEQHTDDTLPFSFLERGMPAHQPASTSNENTFDELTSKIANPLEKSNNLRALYDQYKGSKNSVERYIAYRAWSACFPTFIAAKGQSISLDDLTKGLDKNDPKTAQRFEAYRSLLGKCQQFSGLNRDQLLEVTRLEKEAANQGLSLSPGETANQYLHEGDAQHALQVVQRILASQDAFSIGSLQEFVQPYLAAKVEDQSLPASTRIDLRALAFSIAACDLGLDCGSDSLTAIQLCANTGECTGNLRERYFNRLPDPADKTLLQQETEHVLNAIRSKNFSLLGL
ncbi:MAG: hypothetical protein V4447_09900 [Pseudomonadota bacterium]